MGNSILEIPMSGKVIALIDVPEGLHSPTVTFYDHGKVQYWHVNYQYPEPNVSGGFALFYQMFGGKKNYPKKITVVGIASSLTEDTWKGILPQVRGGFAGHLAGYKDYNDNGLSMDKSPLKSATESGLSLIASNGKKPSTTLVILKNE